MPELLISVPALAKTASWAKIKKERVVAVAIDDQVVKLQLAARPTRIGHLYNLVCPRCGARRRDLYLGDDRAVGCRGADCLRLRHPDQLLSPTQRKFVRPVRQIQRINARLEKRGLDRNLRRRLRRRRARLLTELEETLAGRQVQGLAAMMAMGLRHKVVQPWSGV